MYLFFTSLKDSKTILTKLWELAYAFLLNMNITTSTLKFGVKKE